MTWKKFAFYTIWVAFHMALFVGGFIKQRDDFELRTLDSLGDSVFISRGAGLVLLVDTFLLLLPVCRNIISIIRGSFVNRYIPFDHNIFLHKCTAYSMLFFSLVHTNAHYTNFFKVQEQLPSLGPAWKIHYTEWAGVTGHIMLVLMFFIYTSAKIEVRQKKFETFWYAHHLFIPFYLLLFFHAFGCFVKSTDTGKCKGYGTVYYTVPTFTIYMLERVLREYRGRQPTTLTKVVFHPGKTLELQFDKPSFQYKPGQYLFINIPEVSYFQWHPFTISSTPEEGFVSIHIRLVGDWTNAVAKLLGCFQNGGISKAGNNLPTIRVDGPFGAPAEDFYKYKVACLVGAGIGVTPAASLLKSVWYRYYRKAPMNLQKVYFFWVNRDKEAFEWFQSLLSTLEESVPTSFLEIHVYLTGKLSVDDIQNIVLNDSDDVDPLTELHTRCHYGRPNWNRIFNGVKAACAPLYQDGLEVGVFYCGPAQLAATLKAATSETSSKQVKFDFRKEHF
ncbi:ferric reductase NAD binding domain-containing protein [Blyttiomyces helicus]|uniref:Ferric reductase NAD binding domain-containing protein n=1 Tax=Blyttiomyces helicus TaxID=388810 RepID=A0A4P9W6F0_9FUNG|nr:ferric reductase NAD binding domain-containing protein [Blyttiomyces helicus]|eukprot:RKO87562.1 ferric reductase NAD binding domain-containing protein [Blyttiomyces helicus]